MAQNKRLSNRTALSERLRYHYLDYTALSQQLQNWTPRHSDLSCISIVWDKHRRTGNVPQRHLAASEALHGRLEAARRSLSNVPFYIMPWISPDGATHDRGQEGDHPWNH